MPSESVVEHHKGWHGLWIPIELLRDRRLKTSDRIVYAIVSALGGFDGACFASSKYIALIADVSTKSVQRSVDHLAELKYITKQERQHQTNVLRVADRTLLDKMSRGGRQNAQQRVTLNNTSSNPLSKSSKEKVRQCRTKCLPSQPKPPRSSHDNPIW